MIKFIGISFVAIVLSGCNPSYTDKSTSYLMPEGMKDCKVYVLEADASSRSLTVVGALTQMSLQLTKLVNLHMKL